MRGGAGTRGPDDLATCGPVAGVAVFACNVPPVRSAVCGPVGCAIWLDTTGCLKTRRNSAEQANDFQDCCLSIERYGIMRELRNTPSLSPRRHGIDTSPSDWSDASAGWTLPSTGQMQWDGSSSRWRTTGRPCFLTDGPDRRRPCSPKRFNSAEANA